MPDLNAHRTQVEHNRQAAIVLQQAPDPYLDWVVTMLFYTALHLIDQVLYQNSQLHPRNHRQRHTAIANEPMLASIYLDYRELEHQSRRSRYECARFSSDDVSGLSARLIRIENVVESIVA
jgi:hypothetical protein